MYSLEMMLATHYNLIMGEESHPNKTSRIEKAYPCAIVGKIIYILFGF